MNGRAVGALARRAIGAFGRTGFGKTACVRCVLRDFPRRIIHDANGHDYHAPADAEVIATTRGEVLDYLYGVKREDPFSIIYRNPASDPAPDAADFLARLALKAGSCVLLLEEAASSCAATIVAARLAVYHASKDPKDRPAVHQVATEGRHSEVSLIVATTRPVGVHPDIRAEVYGDECYLFRIKRKDDLRDLENEKGGELAHEVARLRRFECLHLRDDESGDPVVMRERVALNSRGRPELVTVGRVTGLEKSP